MKNAVVLLSLVFIVLGNQSFSQEQSSENEINWISFEEAMEASEKEPKLWFIDMYTDWCGWCKRMDASTFQDPHIIEAINENYYAVKFNAEGKSDIVLDDTTYRFDASLGRRGCHQLAVQLLNGKMSYPSFVFLNEEKQILTTVPGYHAAEEMLPVLEFMAQYDPANPTDYQSFRASFESPYETEDTEEGED